MLMYERVAIGTAGAGNITRRNFDMLAKHAQKNGRIADPVVRDELMSLYAMETCKSLVAMRTRAEMKAGKAPGPGGSLGKLAGSVISRRVRALAQNIEGMDSIAWQLEGDEGQQLARHVSVSYTHLTLPTKA